MEPSKLQSHGFLNKENINIPIATKHQPSRHNPTTPTSKKTININSGKPKKLNILKDGLKTPAKTNVNLKRVPLGNKDGNINTILNIKRTSSTLKEKNTQVLESFHSKNEFDQSKNLNKKPRTPSSNKSSTRRHVIPGAPMALNNKLKVLKDEELFETGHSEIINKFQDDDDIENGPGTKEVPMLDIPHYYTPLTDDDLKLFEQVGSDPRLINLSNDDDVTDLNLKEEFELNFSDLDEETTVDNIEVEDEDRVPNYMKPTIGSKSKTIIKGQSQDVNSDSNYYDGLSVDDLNGLLEL